MHEERNFHTDSTSPKAWSPYRLLSTRLFSRSGCALIQISSANFENNVLLLVDLFQRRLLYFFVALPSLWRARRSPFLLQSTHTNKDRASPQISAKCDLGLNPTFHELEPYELRRRRSPANLRARTTLALARRVDVNSCTTSARAPLQPGSNLIGSRCERRFCARSRGTFQQINMDFFQLSLCFKTKFF